MIFIVKWAWDRLSGLHLNFSASAAMAAAWSWLGWFVHDQAAIWLTAIATVFLWRATAMLTRATNIEHARTGPFLAVILEAEEHPVAGAVNPKTADYQTDWQAADAEHPFLGSRVANNPPRYVSITIRNEQTAAHGVASDIILETELAFGAPDDVAPHPYTVSRTVGPAMALAGRQIEGPLFNVAGLVNWQVIVRKVEYRDIMKRSRSAAVGTGGVFCSVSGNVTPIPRVFEPRRGEYSDAD